MSKDLEISEILLILINNKWKIVISTIIGFLLGLYFSNNFKDEYKVTINFYPLEEITLSPFEKVSTLMNSSKNKITEALDYQDYNVNVNFNKTPNIFLSDYMDELESNILNIANDTIYNHNVFNHLDTYEPHFSIEFITINTESSLDEYKEIAIMSQANVNTQIKNQIKYQSDIMNYNINLSIENLNKKFNNFFEIEKINVRNRIVELEEQAQIARALEISTTSLDCFICNEVLYMKGYIAIEKEIDILKKKDLSISNDDLIRTSLLIQSMKEYREFFNTELESLMFTIFDESRIDILSGHDFDKYQVSNLNQTLKYTLFGTAFGLIFSVGLVLIAAALKKTTQRKDL